MERKKDKQNAKMIWLFMLGLMLCYSCEYEPSDVYHHPANKDIEPPEIEVVKFTLGDVNDTIYLYTDKAVQFHFNSSQQGIKAVEFILNDNSVEVFESANGWFYLYGGQLADGEHTFTVQVYTASGTGSIAEQVGAEAFIFSKSWILVVDKTHKIWTKTEVVNGFLKVSWEKYRANNFKEYVVYRSIAMSGQIEINRVQTNEFIDNGYVGEGGKYSIWINDIYGELFHWCDLELEREFPAMGSKAIENNLYQPYWHKSKYYGAIGKYEAKIQLNHGAVLEKISLNANDTIFDSASACFSDMVEFTVSLVPANPNPFYQKNEYKYAFENQTWERVGNYITDASLHNCEILQMYQKGFSFSSGCDTLMWYSFEQKKVIQKFGYPPFDGCYGCTFSRTSVSASGQSFTANIACWDNVLMVDAENLNKYKVHDLKHYSGQLYSPNIPISDVGLAIVNSLDDSFYIYDFNTKAAVRYTPEYGYARSWKISPNGKYLFIHDNIFKLVRYENGKFTSVGTFPSEPAYYEFNSSNTNQVVEWDGTNFYVRSVDDFSVIRQFSLTDQYIYNIDFHQGEILTRNAGHLYVRSLLTGEILKDIPTTSRCLLINRTLLCEGGVIHYIN